MSGHDDEIIGTIHSRRDLFKKASTVGLASLLPSVAAARETKTAPLPFDPQKTLIATPALTEGPFFNDEKLNRQDITTCTKRPHVTNGTPLELTLKLFHQVGDEWKPLENAQIDIWQCDAIGVYSGEPTNPLQEEDTSGQTWLRGYQTTNDKGEVTFKTIYPGCYLTRCVHIHFKVRVYDENKNVTKDFSSQIFFDETLNDEALKAPAYKNNPSKKRYLNEQDGIFRYRQPDGTTAGSHLMAQGKKVKDKFQATFTIALKA